mmetsp:Transcript_38235/g.82683  ORF Transcript_38235/g.82683 Transcript_38235/m.82683 type:complete len:536 (+) Transcript_38235:201-1808(+)
MAAIPPVQSDPPAAAAPPPEVDLGFLGPSMSGGAAEAVPSWLTPSYEDRSHSSHLDIVGGPAVSPLPLHPPSFAQGAGMAPKIAPRARPVLRPIVRPVGSIVGGSAIVGRSSLLAPIGGGAVLPVSSGNDKATCSLHGKIRKMEVLEPDGKGGLVCIAGNECKGSVPAAAQPPPPGGLTTGGDAMCSIHHKSRNCKYLTVDASGQLVCLPGFECKGIGTGQPSSTQTSMCTLHGKMRTFECLVHDTGTGKLICAPGKECKGVSVNMLAQAGPGGLQQPGLTSANPAPPAGPPTESVVPALTGFSSAPSPAAPAAPAPAAPPAAAQVPTTGFASTPPTDSAIQAAVKAAAAKIAAAAASASASTPAPAGDAAAAPSASGTGGEAGASSSSTAPAADTVTNAAALSAIHATLGIQSSGFSNPMHKTKIIAKKGDSSSSSSSSSSSKNDKHRKSSRSRRDRDRRDDRDRRQSGRDRGRAAGGGSDRRGGGDRDRDRGRGGRDRGHGDRGRDRDGDRRGSGHGGRDRDRDRRRSRSRRR